MFRLDVKGMDGIVIMTFSTAKEILSVMVEPEMVKYLLLVEKTLH